jgi:hypothetical protein
MNSFRHLSAISAVLVLLGTAGAWPVQSAEVTDAASVASAGECAANPPLADTETPSEHKVGCTSESRSRFAKDEAESARKDFDPEWSRRATRQIFDAFDETLKTIGSDLSLKVRLISANCGEKQCRIELMHTDSSALSLFTAQFQAHLSWRGASEMHHPDNFTTTLYFAREEDKPPQPRN